MAEETSVKDRIVPTKSHGYDDYLLNQMKLSRNPNSEKKLGKLLYMRTKNSYSLIKTIIITACLRQYRNQRLHCFARQ